MIRAKFDERETKKSTQEKKQHEVEAPPKIHNHHSIDAILGRKQVDRPNQKPSPPNEVSEDEDEHVSDAELSSSEAKSGSQHIKLLF